MVEGLDRDSWTESVQEAGLSDDLMKLRPYHVVVPAHRVEEVLRVVAEISGSSRPRLKEGYGVVTMPDREGCDLFQDVSDSASDQCSITLLSQSSVSDSSWIQSWLEGAKDRVLHVPIRHQNVMRTFLNEARRACTGLGHFRVEESQQSVTNSRVTRGPPK